MGRPVIGSSLQRGAPLNDQAGDIQAPRIRIVGTDEIAAALDSAGLHPERAVIVLVGVAAEGTVLVLGPRRRRQTRSNWSRTTRCSSWYPALNGETRRGG
jgi:hypothetical protein